MQTFLLILGDLFLKNYSPHAWNNGHYNNKTAAAIVTDAINMSHYMTVAKCRSAFRSYYVPGSHKF